MSAEEMENTSRTLSELSFYAIQNNGSYEGFTVSLTHTSASDLSDTFADNYDGNEPNVVFSRLSYSINSNPVGWKPMVFDQPFTYNGTDNLLIEIRWIGGSGVVHTGATEEEGWKRTLLGTANASTGTRQNFRNVLQFTYSTEDLYVLSGTVKDMNGDPVPGVQMHGAPNTPLTDANGNYNAFVPTGWNGSIAPLADNHVFDPPFITFTSVSADAPQQDFTAASTAGLEPQSISVTYTDGDIPSDPNFMSQGGNSEQPAILSVPLPPDAVITGIDVSYTMTSDNIPWMEDQRSWIRCVSPNGTGEEQISYGTGRGNGTVNYNRTGLRIANNVRGGGEITFEMHAGRSRGGVGINTTFVWVNNNTWTITVHYVQVSFDADPLTSFQQWLISNELSPDASSTEPCASGAHTLGEAFIAGICPTNSTARFVINHSSRATDGHIVLQWEGVEGRRYNVYWSSNLLHGAGFERIATDIPHNATTFTNIMQNGKGFYRIDVQRDE